MKSWHFAAWGSAPRFQIRGGGTAARPFPVPLLCLPLHLGKSQFAHRAECFVASVRRGCSSLQAISSRGHFVTSHFVAGDTLSLHGVNFKYLCVNYAVFICCLCLQLFVRHPCRLSTKCPRNKMAGDEVSQKWNSWRPSVPAPKWLATKCPRDEMAGDEVTPHRNGRQWNGCDERGVPVCSP